MAVHELVRPASLLDTDLYKLTMQQAVLHHFPDCQASYRFTHRDQNVYFSRQCYEKFIAALPGFADLALTDEEHQWLRKACPFFTTEYLQYLRGYRFKPEQVKPSFTPVSEDGEMGRIYIEATGPWAETIFWEVPLMAVLSETYFKTVDVDWTLEGQDDIAYGKAKALLEAGCIFSEFGTRRRRSFEVQDLVVRALLRAENDLPDKGKVTGTSNVHLAHKYGIAPIGTIAHEWFMGVAALKGYQRANALALDLWEQVYPQHLLFALTDTFSTRAFFQDFVSDPERVRRWRGLRQDSGDPLEFAPRAKEMYESVGVDFREKAIIYSDGLNLEKALKLKKQCDDIGFQVSFGIGTYLTNDFYSTSSGRKEKSKALNMVIKLASAGGKPCIKISDDLMKNTGDSATVLHVKNLYGLPTS